MRWPSGTSIYDVVEPAPPELLARIDLPEGWHSHKVRVANGIMIVNHEKLGQGGAPEFGGGLGIYDVSRPERAALDHQMGDLRRTRRAPLRFRRPLRLYLADRRGLCRQHRHDPRSRRPGPPARGRRAGGSPANGPGAARNVRWSAACTPRCHHPMRAGDRLYVSYWQHGFYILDISDMTRPKAIAHRNSQPQLRPPDPYLPADPAGFEGPPGHGRGRRGRGEAATRRRPRFPGSTTYPTRPTRCRSRPSRWRDWTPTARRSRR